MDVPPHSLVNLTPAYLAQIELPHFEQYSIVPTELQYTSQYTPNGFDETPAFTWQAQAIGGPVVATQHHAVQLSNLTTLHSGHTQSDAGLSGSSQSAPSAMRTSHALPTDPLCRPRKRKAATLRADDWEPYKDRILELHIEQKRPLPEVRQTLEKEYGFEAELRQYRLRISQWGKDKNVKPQEMQAIVRKRQKRKLVETDKGQLAFEVRGSEVELRKIERWMKRHDVVESALYAPSPAAPTPSDVGCYTISERGSPAMTTVSVYSPIASISSPRAAYLMAQSPRMLSPALSMLSLLRAQASAFAGKSPALSHRSLSNPQVSFVHSPIDFGSAMTVGARTQYKQAEEQHLRYQILGADMSTYSGTVAASDLLYKLGGVLIDQGRYMAAEDIIRKLVGFHESHSGDSDGSPDALKALDLLGQALEYQGLYVEAEILFRRALQGKERVLTSEHPDTLTTMDNLARVLSRQGRIRDAKEQNTRAQVLCMRVLGPNHALTLTSMSNSARVLDKLGSYEEAALMHSETLSLQKRVLGLRNAKTLTSMNNLARVLCRQGLYKEAEVQANKTLGLHKEVLGSGHPDTLASQYTLGMVLVYQHKYEEAEAIHRETLAFRQKVLRPEHPDILRSMLYLGIVLYWRGRYKEAEATLGETRAMYEKVLGPEHPNALDSVSCLALTLDKQGRFDEAEAMHREAIRLFKEVLGPEHPNTVTSINRLAGVLHGQGRYNEAEAMDREATLLFKKVLGPEHPFTLISIECSAHALYRQGRYDEAEVMTRDILALRKKVLGPKHPHTIESVRDLRVVLERQGRFEEVFLVE